MKYDEELSVREVPGHTRASLGSPEAFAFAFSAFFNLPFLTAGSPAVES